MSQTRRPKPGGRALWYAAFLLSPALLLLCVQLVTLGSMERVGQWLAQAPGAAGMSALFLLAALALLTALTGRLWAGFLLLEPVPVALALANYLKLAMNNAPLLLSDLSMALHLEMLSGYVPPHLRLSRGALAGLALALALPVALVLLQGFAPPPRPGAGRRFLGVALAGAVMLAVPAAARDAAAGTAEESQDQRNWRLGLLAGLYSGFLNRKSPEPEGYAEESVKAVLEQAARDTGQEDPPDPVRQEQARPSVIMLMSESFCEPEEILPGAAFDTDPIANFHAAREAFPGGQFLSNTYAGGTGNVEMEVLTGIPTAFLGEGESLTTLSGREVYSRLPSVAKAFRDAGYTTGFFHNYTAQLYGRREHLPCLGFETLRFEPDFPEQAPRSGPYLSDMALAQELIYAFQNREEDKPAFFYAVSMENHQPYYGDKFSRPSGLGTSCPGLDEEQLGTVDALAQGLHGADAALGALTEYFSSCGEPVVLIFWGDHLPGLYADEENSLYSTLGYVPTADTLLWDAGTLKRMLTTPFLVWNNYDAALDVPELASAGSLGTLAMDWAGIPKPPYFRWVDSALHTMLLYRQRLYVGADGQAWDRPPQEDLEVVENYRKLVYDILYGEGFTLQD